MRSFLASHDLGGLVTQEGDELFRIPRDLLLSTRTSNLPNLLGAEDWQPLDKEWAGLILCMMWEESKGPQSRWHAYFGGIYDQDTFMG